MKPANKPGPPTMVRDPTAALNKLLSVLEDRQLSDTQKVRIDDITEFRDRLLDREEQNRRDQ